MGTGQGCWREAPTLPGRGHELRWPSGDCWPLECASGSPQISGWSRGWGGGRGPRWSRAGPPAQPFTLGTPRGALPVTHSLPSVAGSTPGWRCPEGLLSTSLGGAGSVGCSSGALGLPSEWQAGATVGSGAGAGQGSPSLSRATRPKARPVPGAGCGVMSPATPPLAWRMGRGPAPHSSPRPLDAPLLVRRDPLWSVSAPTAGRARLPRGLGDRP